jgi:hypothetical protein
MKKVALFLIIGLVVFSCKKDNELDDSALGFNPYENPVNPYVTVVQSTVVNSNILILDLQIHRDRIPDNVDMRFVQQGIIDPFGDTLVTAKERNIFVRKNETGPSAYQIGLYDTENNRISTLFEYTYQ